MKIFKALGRLIIFLLILILILSIGLYFVFYFAANEDHRPYMDYIVKYSEENDLDARLVTAVVKTESDFNEEAQSGAGAYGLMQVVPETGQWVADRLEESFSTDSLLDPETNIRYGAHYLAYLIDYYKSIDYAIIAYNAGIGNVDLWIREGILSGDVADYENIPFNESKRYIEKVRSLYELNKVIFDEYYLDKDSNRWVLAFNLYKNMAKDLYNKVDIQTKIRSKLNI